MPRRWGVRGWSLRPARAERLLRLWTLKEAVAKAIGSGLLAPFRALGIPDGPRWRFATWWLTPHHVAAVAVLGGPPEEPVVARLEEERPSG